ncbi:cold shock domain-containing protein [Stieleria sp. JC731]|uniref:cold-shock protein n=1 Tax=Pirellulaceae TaxID=2691357 RepID=UPI001E4783EC|nr:cold shock domain-containing protein [Stieleria sp. JC731]MCC9599361.1 cold shock domain-containing protein [Stieleria sp. JC731]
MPRDSSAPREDEPAKKFRITRKRLGTIRFIDDKGEFGFIDAEDFRDDVFFHHSVWEPGEDFKQPSPPPRQDRRPQRRDGRPSHRDRHVAPLRRTLSKELIGRHVEFEVDDELMETDKKLRATVVMPTKRPMGRRMTGRDATFNIVTHHPKARRKRPDWRK